jgi:methylenetetrahydrofolate reductase (NADPH)
MPFLPAPRYQAPFKPYKNAGEALVTRALGRLERMIKGPLFGCRMCGTCILGQTAYICPMTCPKGLRNGLCGGATPEACEVDPSRPCTWYLIYDRAKKLGTTDRLLEINAPLDGERVGRGSWIALFRAWRSRRKGPRVRDVLVNRQRFNREKEALLLHVRQPSWWGGDDAYHGAAYERSASALEESLRGIAFVVTAEITPPRGAAPHAVREKVALLKGSVVAANFTDNASASPRMSSLACSRIALDSGVEPVMQLQARDRSRVVLESEAMGAAGLGIPNLLCLSGDHQSLGPSPVAKPDQFDMDSIQLLWMLRRLRDDGLCLDGKVVDHRPQFFLGAAASPFGAPSEYEAIRTEKKINAGAQFIQTQPVFDYPRFLGWLEALDRRSLLEKVHILAGLTPLKSARAASFMSRQVPGVVIPEATMRRMTEASGEEAQAEEGVRIAREILAHLKATPGIRGVHIMAVHWESIIPRLVKEADLTVPGP